jgi:aspartyl-tRNA(Asn)/glutamyl-tRNA(Gln) amidotransferase subunit A
MKSNSSIPPLSEIANALRSGKLSAAELAEDCIGRRNNALHAYKSWRPDVAIDMATLADQAFSDQKDLGALQGIPISLKDLYAVQDMEIYAGSPRLLPDTLRFEGPLVAKLRQQRAVFTGKTHTVEFAFGGLGVNSHWGTPRNPWDATIHRVPGGSSSGAGVSLIEGSSILAFGSDTAGSVRIPASLTGTVGLKTTHGRWPLTGIFPLSPTLDTPGLLARTAADMLFAFAAIDPQIQRSYGGLLDQANHLNASEIVIATAEPKLWQDCDPGIAEAVDTALSELSRLGVKVINLPIPEVADAIELLHVGNVVAYELGEFLKSELPEWLETLDPVVSTRLKDGVSISLGEYQRRRLLLEQLHCSVHSHFERCDVIASPTVAITAPDIAEVSAVSGYRSQNMAVLRNTCAGNSLGLCAITLPIGLDTSGMPVGLQLMGENGQDEKLVCIASCIERLIGNRADRIGPAPNISS